MNPIGAVNKALSNEISIWLSTFNLNIKKESLWTNGLHLNSLGRDLLEATIAVFFKTIFLKNFAILAEKHLC